MRMALARVGKGDGGGEAGDCRVALESTLCWRGSSDAIPRALSDKGRANFLPRLMSAHFSSTPRLPDVTARHRAAWGRTHAPSLKIVRAVLGRICPSSASSTSISAKRNLSSDSNDPASYQIKAAQTARRCLQTAMTTRNRPQRSCRHHLHNQWS